LIDLSINIGELELKNPFIVASSENVRNIRQIVKAEEYGASAVILKAMFPPGSIPLKSRLRPFIDARTQTICGLCDGGGNRVLNYDEGIELVRAAKRDSKIKIGVNLAFPKARDYEHLDYKHVVDVSKRAAQAGADFIEINFKGTTFASILVDENRENNNRRDKAQDYGEYVSKYLVKVTEATQSIRQAVDIPVMAKIDPQMGDVAASALAMERGGADAVEAANINGGSVAIDIYNRGNLRMAGSKKAILHTVGAPYKTYAQGFVAHLAQAIHIPIIGSGGLMNWQDTVEMIMFGATATSFCTLLMINGFEAIREIENGMRAFMEQQGYSKVEDLRGLALDYINLDFKPEEIISSIAEIDRGKCTGCGTCLKPAHCLAISMGSDRVEVDPGACVGCGTCILLCPQGAISLNNN
jgi:dihydropyrimidine dehydrogenase (NAD+) subunit PreA